MKDNSSGDAEGETPVEVEATGETDSSAPGSSTDDSPSDEEPAASDESADEDSSDTPSLEDDDETSQTKVGLPRTGPLSEAGQAEAMRTSDETADSAAAEASGEDDSGAETSDEGDWAGSTDEAGEDTGSSDGAGEDTAGEDSASADTSEGASSVDAEIADATGEDTEAAHEPADAQGPDETEASSDDTTEGSGEAEDSEAEDSEADADTSGDADQAGAETGESRAADSAASAGAPSRPPVRSPDSDRVAQRGPDGRPRPPAQPGRPRTRPESGERPVLRDGMRPARPGDPRQGDPRQGDRRRPTRDGRPTPPGARPARSPADAQRRKSGSRPGSSEVIGKAISGLGGRIGQVESNTQKIARAMVEIVKEGENRKKAYDVLYGEMRQYKENFLWQCQKPLFMDLMSLFDSILRVERKYDESESAAEGSGEAVSEDLRYLKEELLEILYRYDIELIEDHPERLEISFQKPIKRIDSDDPDDDRRVVQYVREGFTRDKTVLRPQEIVVKRYSGAKEA